MKPVPDSVSQTVSQFNRCLHLGEFDKAFELLQPELEKPLPDPRIVAAYITVAERFQCAEHAIELGSQCLDAKEIDPVAETELLFNLGNLYDTLQQYELAFHAFENANWLKGRQYDLASDLFYLEETQKVFSTQYRHLLAATEDASSNHLFIIGMPRSGTSLLEQVLDMHTQIQGCGESDALHRLAWSCGTRVEDDTPYPYALWKLDRPSLAAMTAEYKTHFPYDDSSSGRFFIDKMPHNYHHAGLIKMLLPQAPIIHARRHPLDTCLSIYFRDFIGQHDYAYDLEDIANRYLLYLAWMQLWRQEVGIEFIEVGYEDWIMQPERELTRVLSALSLPWEDALLQHQHSGRAVTTASYQQVREPLHGKSVQRWRHYEAWLGPLIEILAPVL